MAVSSIVASWRTRSSRERLLLALGTAVVLLALGYALIWDPLLQARARLEKRLPQLRAETRLMQARVREIERLRAAPAKAEPASLLGRVGVSANDHGLRDRLRELSPAGEERVRVLGDEVPLQAWLTWLRDLEGQGARIVYCRMVPAKTVGAVAVEALLQGEPR